MEVIENKYIKEKCYMQKLENGLQVIIIPKKNIQKKYIIWATHFGSIDNKFIDYETKKEITIPDGVAHFLEHKMFEQKNGVDSLYTLMALGIDANAYTTNDHTAYLFECTNNFYEGLDELMDYVQNPYFTDQNVEKEKGIIAQEIRMYDDDPGWQLYMGILDCLYKNNPIKVDIAGTVESISKITPEVLYKCYNTFYALDNMTLVICGDFEPEKLLEEVKKRLTKNKTYEKIERIYPEKEKTINKKYVEKNMNVSMPIFAIGIKDVSKMDSEIVKKHIAIEILLNMIIGKSSDLYKKMYNQGLLLEEPSIDYEFSEEYAHIVISGQSNDSEEVYKMFKEEIENYKNNELNIDHFERIKKKIYGDYVVEYNSVSEIARMFLTDHMKKISSFDYIEQYKVITKEYVEQVLKEIFNDEYMALAIVKEKD